MVGSAQQLVLYHFDACPWCQRVRAAIDDLGLEVELRNVKRDPAHLRELQAAMGRATVPVLRTEHGGAPTWLPESADIVEHLYATYGHGRAPTFFASAWPQRIGLIAAAGLAIAAIVAPPEYTNKLLLGALLVFTLRNSLPLLRRWLGTGG